MIMVKDLGDALQLKLLTAELENEAIAVEGCYIGDLLSNVMAKAKEGDVWMTVVTNPNIAAVAHLLSLPAIVLLEGHQPMPETLRKVKEERIPLFLTGENAYEMAIRFQSLHLTGDPDKGTDP
jgi:hypothetical protein